jgi:hypothetical protein
VRDDAAWCSCSWATRRSPPPPATRHPLLAARRAETAPAGAAARGTGFGWSASVSAKPARLSLTPICGTVSEVSRQCLSVGRANGQETRHHDDAENGATGEDQEVEEDGRHHVYSSSWRALRVWRNVRADLSRRADYLKIVTAECSDRAVAGVEPPVASGCRRPRLNAL